MKQFNPHRVTLNQVRSWMSTVSVKHRPLAFEKLWKPASVNHTTEKTLSDGRSVYHLCWHWKNSLSFFFSHQQNSA